MNPYTRLGLSGNPFQVIDDPQMLRRAVAPALVSLADALATAEQPVIEILGERGWGKSTLLTLIRARGEAQSQRRWATDYVELGQTKLTPPRQSVPGWTIDEAQRLSRKVQHRLLQMAKQGAFRLVIGTHESLAPLACDVDVDVRTIHLVTSTVADLQAMLVHRIAVFAQRPVHTVLADDAAQRARQYAAGNRRTFEELMYEVFCAFARDGSLPRVISRDAVEVGIAAQTWS